MHRDLHLTNHNYLQERKGMDPLKVLILYGGEAATKPRNELLEWLNSSQTHDEIGRKVDARKVAEMTAHMDRSIDQRVEDMMDWADKAIFLLTTDTRSAYGAPNVLEEFGRWIGQKGRRTMMALRQEGVEVHSNASGLVYVAFEDDVVDECRKRLVAFLNDPIPAVESAETVTQQTIAQSSGPQFSIGGNVDGPVTFGDGNTTTNTSAGGDVNQGTIINNHYYGTPPAQQPNTLSPQSQPEQGSATDQSKEISVVELKDFLSDKYNIGELKEICFRLRIEAEEFSSSKTTFVIQFVQYLERRGMFEELMPLLVDTRGKQLEKAFGSKNITVD